MIERTEQIKFASNGAPALATLMSNLSTAQQIKIIRQLSTRLQTDSDEISRRLFGCYHEELSDSGAHDAIRELEKQVANLGSFASD